MGTSDLPLVIKRGERFVSNDPIREDLTQPQRAALGAMIWDQVLHLLTINDLPRKPKDVDKVAGEIVGSGTSSVYRARAIGMKQPDLLPRLYAGEITLNDGLREVGHSTSHRKGDVPIGNDVYYGKGDKFDDVLIPLLRYLRAWEKKGFEFRHINPKEAQRRREIIADATSLLDEATKDLAMRSHVATLRVPDRKERRMRLDG